MCVVVYKPKDKEMPNYETLLDCFVANPDGAGYMFPKNNKVKIRKGFMTFPEFYNSLMDDYKDVGPDKDFVLHFRISTQGGVNRPLCHPYPVSKTMDDLRQLEAETNIGVAHNGIISLTSEYSYSRSWDYGYYGVQKKEPNYNDTMTFITKYLSLIMKDDKDVFDDDKEELIEKLIGGYNKLAIMTPKGVKLIGNFVDIGGILYSNNYFIGRGFSSNKKCTVEVNGEVLDYDDADLDYLEKDLGIEGFGKDIEEKEDYSEKLGCGYAENCKKCTKFMECYGFEMPDEWKKLTNEEIEYCLDYYTGVGGDADKVEKLEDKATRLAWGLE